MKGRLDRLTQLAYARQRPNAATQELDRRFRLVIADITTALAGTGTSSNSPERRAIIDAVCRRHDFPTLAELEESQRDGHAPDVR
ncbi:MAG TPA: hypothetical protein VFZ80_02415 [Acidimicrobiia bacterium]